MAFIETAWRRYTKHSRNKVQEIQGAIEPLAATYHNVRPFKGAVLAGTFTGGALTQLRSLGFSLLIVPYDHVVAVFREFGIDASSDERTSDRDFQRKTNAFRRLSSSKRRQIVEKLVPALSEDVKAFVKSLWEAVSRTVARVIIIALHGMTHEANTVGDAIQFIDGYESGDNSLPVVGFKVELRYNNGDVIRGSFSDKTGAIAFLHDYHPAQ